MSRGSYLLSSLSIVFYFLLIGTWISLPDEYILNFVLICLSTASTVGAILLNRRKFHKFYSSSSFRSFVSSLISVIVLFCILALVNFIGFKNPFQWDASREKHHTLSEYSKKVLKKFETPVTAKIFSGKNGMIPIKKILELYNLHDSTLEIEMIDIERMPGRALLYNVKKSGTIMLSYGERTQYIEVINEKTITDALNRLLVKRVPVVYFTNSHGEIDLFLDENEGGSALLDFLKKADIIVKTLPELNVTLKPKDLHLLVVWGPKLEFSEKEILFLKKHFKDGKPLMIALDPQFGTLRTPKLRDLLEEYGLIVHNDIIVDISSSITGSHGTIPVVATYDKTHSITKGFTGPLFFPLASSIEIVNRKGMLGRYTPLLMSAVAPYSWSEKKSDQFFNDEIKFDKGIDREGPQIFSLAYEEKNSKKLIVFGNSTFLTNTYEKFQKHFLFFLNSVIWEIEGGSLLSFDRPMIEEGIVFIGRVKLGLIFYSTVIFLPLILLSMSFGMYRRRTM